MITTRRITGALVTAAPRATATRITAVAGVVTKTAQTAAAAALDGAADGLPVRRQNPIRFASTLVELSTHYYAVDGVVHTAGNRTHNSTGKRFEHFFFRYHFSTPSCGSHRLGF